MLVVVTIIALFAALVLPENVPAGRRRAGHRGARADQRLHDRAGRLQARHEHVPDNGAGPRGAARATAGRGAVEGPYLPQDIPKDPWGRPYVYKYPGEHGDEPDIVSLGADGEPGGEDINADIVSWKNQ